MEYNVTVFLNNKFIGALLCASLALFFAFFSGIFNKQLDLLVPTNVSNIEAVLIGNATGSVSIPADGTVLSKCKLPKTKDIDFCGIRIALNTQPDIPELGIDLSSYTHIELKSNVIAPVESPAIRVTMRTFHPNYSSVDDPLSPKYNTMIVPAGDTESLYVPVKLLQVETWWVKQLGISLEDSATDISNVLVIEILNHETQLGGAYEIELSVFKMHGKYLSLNQLLIITSLLWALVIVLLVLKHNQKMHEMSILDPLTGLCNRRGMQSWIEKRQPSKSKPVNMTLFYMDIDDFKSTNDTYGHKAGDALLQGFANSVKHSLASSKLKENNIPNCLYVRMSGDEFVILAADITQKQATELADRILVDLKTPINVGKVNINVSISMGIATYDVDSVDTRKLFEKADKAMYVAKSSGKNQYKVFNAEQDQNVAPRKNVARCILEAIEAEQFALKFMPIFDISTKQVSHVEVLLRGLSEELKALDTSSIISSAEEFKLVSQIDAWVLKSTLEVLAQNRDLIKSMNLTFCINISTLDIGNMDFCKHIENQLIHYDIPPNWIELEITETALNLNTKNCVTCLQRLRDIGVNLSLDDFGTGYTGFNQLIDYPISRLKIDRSFVSSLSKDNEKGEVLINAILLIADTYKLDVTAIGVETLDQYYALKDKGVDAIQGYLFSEPLTLPELTRGLRNQSNFGISGPQA